MIPRPFALVGFGFALALLVLSFFDGAVYVLVPSAVCVLVLCLAVKQLEKRGIYAVAMLSVLLACFCFNVRETYTYTPATELAGEGRAVHAQLVSNPVKTDGTWRYTLKVLSVDGKAVNCKMALSSNEAVDAQPYDFVDFSGEVISIEQINPDIKNYYKSKNIFLVSYGFDDVSVTPCADKPIGRHLLKINAYLSGRIRTLLDGEAAAIAAGMLTGDKTGISEFTERHFSRTGLSHMLAVSGLHMSILIMSLYKLLCIAFKRFYRIWVVGCVAAAVLYAGVTGFSPSAVRACIMLSVMLGGKLFIRRADTLNSMGLAALIIAVINPFAVADWSFMLSFSATLGIVLLNRYISAFSKKLCSKIKIQPMNLLVSVLTEAAGISLAATLFCLPVMVLFVGAVSTVFLPANLLTLYAVPAVLVTALISALPLGVVSVMSAWLCSAFCEYILAIVKFLSGFEYAQVSVDSLLIKASLAAAVAVILLAVLFVKNRRKLNKFIALVLAFTAMVNICFGTAMNYKQVSIAVSKNCVVVFSGSTAAAIAYGYYGCYQAAGIFEEYAIDNVNLVLPTLEPDTNMYKAEKLFENYNVERLIISEKHNYRFLAENYEITENTAFEFGGIRFEYCGNYCRVVSGSGTVLIALEPDVPKVKTDFLVTVNGLPVMAEQNDYTAVINSGKNISAAYGGREYRFDTGVLLRYNGFGRYEVKGW